MTLLQRNLDPTFIKGLLKTSDRHGKVTVVGKVFNMTYMRKQK
jgi:hypothetical protein